MERCFARRELIKWAAGAIIFLFPQTSIYATLRAKERWLTLEMDDA